MSLFTIVIVVIALIALAVAGYHYYRSQMKAMAKLIEHSYMSYGCSQDDARKGTVCFLKTLIKKWGYLKVRSVILKNKGGSPEDETYFFELLSQCAACATIPSA